MEISDELSFVKEDRAKLYLELEDLKNRIKLGDINNE